MKPSQDNQPPGKTDYCALKSKFFVITTLQIEILPFLQTENQAKFQDVGQEANHPEKPLPVSLPSESTPYSLKTHYSPAGEQQTPVERVLCVGGWGDQTTFLYKRQEGR